MPGHSGDLSLETTQVLAALSKAPTVQEKNAILEAFLLRHGSAMGQANSVVSADAHGFEEQSDTVWRVSGKSAEAISGLRREQSSRQWEIDAIVRSIIEHVHSGQRGENIAGVAMPFKPTPQDMSKAIEALGYSSRAFYLSAMRESVHDEASDSRPLPGMRMILTVFGLLLVAAVFMSV